MIAFTNCKSCMVFISSLSKKGEILPALVNQRVFLNLCQVLPKLGGKPFVKLFQRWFLIDTKYDSDFLYINTGYNGKTQGIVVGGTHCITSNTHFSIFENNS